MTFEELKKSSYYPRIPAEGYLIAVFKNRILFERCRKETDGLCFPGEEEIRTEELLRLHCFDRDTEYRLLVTDDGDRLVELVLNAEQEKAMEPDLLFEDEMLVRPEYRPEQIGIQKLKVVNRYRYTDFDTMTPDNYRISF